MFETWPVSLISSAQHHFRVTEALPHRSINSLLCGKQSHLAGEPVIFPSPYLSASTLSSEYQLIWLLFRSFDVRILIKRWQAIAELLLPASQYSAAAETFQPSPSFPWDSTCHFAVCPQLFRSMLAKILTINGAEFLRYKEPEHSVSRLKQSYLQVSNLPTIVYRNSVGPVSPNLQRVGSKLHKFHWYYAGGLQRRAKMGWGYRKNQNAVYYTRPGHIMTSSL